MKSQMYFLLSLCSILFFASCQKVGIDEEPITPKLLNVPLNGLLAYFPMNGNANDISGNEYHGIMHNVISVEDRNGAEDGAMYFDGSSYIEIPRKNELHFGGFSPYTIGAWVKNEGMDDARSIVISKFNGGVAAGWYLGIDKTGEVRSYRNVVPWSLGTDESILTDKYYHLATSYDGSILRIYINGEEIAYKAFTSHPSDKRTPTIIGGIHSRNNLVPSYKGEIDDLVLYNRVLTESEIKSLASQ